MNKVNFLKESIKSIKTSGTIIPSSKFLVNTMLESIDFSVAKIIVEFGPGNGKITKEILKRLSSDAMLISFEINENFYKSLLKIEDSKFKVVKSSAENIQDVLNAYGFIKADYIISSLPLTNIPKSIGKSILINAYNALAKNGNFIQYQYSLTYLKTIKTIFKENLKLGFEPLNIPPAFIYTSKKVS